MTETNRRYLFLALCALALLQTGGHLNQSYVNYPSWHLIEAESFKPYHWAITIRSGVFALTPRFVEIILGLIVLRFRPRAVNRWVILVGVGLAVGALLTTALLSRPVHRALDIQGNTPELLASLMATDWIRIPLEVARAALYVWALSRTVKLSESPVARVIA
jgi:hypothetical protein